MLERLKTLIGESDQASDQAEKMLIILKKLKLNTHGKEELLNEIGLSNHTKNVRRYIDSLGKLNLIEKTIPNKRTSPNQEYRLTIKGENLLD
jgi:ATP-dependent DNA helicase RecG